MTVRAVLRVAAQIVTRQRPGLAYALTVGVAATIADLLGHLIPMSNGYWMPMMLLPLLRPERRETSMRTIARLAGTFSGAALITLVRALLRPQPPLITELIAMSAWSCYALLSVNYALFSFCITSYVVLLFALAGLPEPVAALHRTAATLLGGIIALAAHTLCRRLVRATDAGCA